jgi:hypothetical protein
MAELDHLARDGVLLVVSDYERACARRTSLLAPLFLRTAAVSRYYFIFPRDAFALRRRGCPDFPLRSDAFNDTTMQQPPE